MAMECSEPGCVRIAEARGLCGGCYKRKRRQDPVLAERDRVVARAWKTSNESHVRAYQHQRDRALRGRCEVCGGLMGIGTLHDGICATCREAGARWRRELIVALWARDRTQRQIADVLGWSFDQVSAEVGRMRELGYDLPRRRTPEQCARIRAGRWPDKIAA